MIKGNGDKVRNEDQLRLKKEVVERRTPDCKAPLM